MKIEKAQNLNFKANIIHKHGVKKVMIANIDKYWQELRDIPNDIFNQKAYSAEIMGNKPFNAKKFYNSVIRKFKEETKDFDFNLIAKKDKKWPYIVELKTKDGAVYKVAESRNYPLWLTASDLFRSNALITKAENLLDYNEKGSQLEQSFNKFWYNKIVEDREKNS